MKSNNAWRLRRPKRRPLPLSAQAQAEAYDEALGARARFRQERAATDAGRTYVAADWVEEEAGRRARYAEAVARAEFGRFYRKDRAAGRPARPQRREPRSRHSR